MPSPRRRSTRSKRSLAVVFDCLTRIHSQAARHCGQRSSIVRVARRRPQECSRDLGHQTFERNPTDTPRVQLAVPRDHPTDVAGLVRAVQISDRLLPANRAIREWQSCCGKPFPLGVAHAASISPTGLAIVHPGVQLGATFSRERQMCDAPVIFGIRTLDYARASKLFNKRLSSPDPSQALGPGSSSVFLDGQVHTEHSLVTEPQEPFQASHLFNIATSLNPTPTI